MHNEPYLPRPATEEAKDHFFLIGIVPAFVPLIALMAGALTGTASPAYLFGPTLYVVGLFGVLDAPARTPTLLLRTLFLMLALGTVFFSLGIIGALVELVRNPENLSIIALVVVAAAAASTYAGIRVLLKLSIPRASNNRLERP